MSSKELAVRHPGGRPSSYRPEFAKQAFKLCRLGATDVGLADFFEVNVRTILRWRAAIPEFCHALKRAKEEADARVERSLYLRAAGYSYDAVKIFCHQGKVIEASYREHLPPDVLACIFWLKNRRPEEWGNRQKRAGETAIVVSPTTPSSG